MLSASASEAAGNSGSPVSSSARMAPQLHRLRRRAGGDGVGGGCFQHFREELEWG